MRNLKKILAVATASVMTMAMSVSAFAATSITFHFQNNDGWENVGAWVYEGIGWTTNVTTDAAIICTNHDEPKPLWPGAKCVDEGNGWVKYTATFSDDVCKNGIAMIFNNFVADSQVTETSEQCDIDAMVSSGVPTTATAEKKQTGNIIINKKNAILSSGTAASEVYVSYNGTEVTPSAEVPADYQPASSGSGDNGSSNAGSSSSTVTPGTTTQNADGSSSVVNADGTVTTTAADGTVTTSKGSTTSTSSVKTGDTVAVSLIVLAVAAAAVVVATKKKVNA